MRNPVTGTGFYTEKLLEIYMKPGEYQELVVVNLRDHGAYLGETADAPIPERVLLPKKQVPEGLAKGDTIRVFLYRDSEDRLIATTAEPLITVGQVARLVVKQTTNIGAFLSWGLEKDLLLPFHEQTKKVEAGEEILAALYVDKSGRLAATMKLYPYLTSRSPYLPDASVEGYVYQIAPNFGTFVAVDDKYSGLIPKKEMSRARVGDRITCRVTHVKEDGKLDLSERGKAWEEMEGDAESVLRILAEDFQGSLPHDDKASPELIREEFGLSKAAFKRAVGRLLKEEKILLKDGKILVSGK